MEKICAWCKKHICFITPSSFIQCNITHGICNRCAEKINSEMGLELTEFLDELEAPIVMVDEKGTVKTANSTAQKLLNKGLQQISGYRGGEVFDCVYSQEPEGCGNTVHCATCTIRMSVMKTFRTGISLLKTPALLYTGDPQSAVRVDFLISTEKIDNYVLLRVDDLRIG